MTDIVIAGGGPVGLGLAIDLGQRGIACTVIERHEQVHSIPKGQNLTQRTGEHLHAWGCDKQIRGASPIPHEYGIVGMVSYGTLLFGYSYSWFRRADVRRFYAADNERLPQYDTERVLRQRAADLANVEVRYGWSAEAITQDEDGVTVGVSETCGGGRDEVPGDFAIGCDGSHSTLRSAAGIEQDVDSHGKRMMLLVIRSSELNQLVEDFPGISYFNILMPRLDGYWMFFGRVDLDGTWFVHAPVPAGTNRDNFDFAAFLHEAVGVEFAVEIDHVGFWDLRIAVARNYRNGRVLIAGDAAHSHPPYGGYGINLGLEDARNLGWKLQAVSEGWAGPGLLDSYSAERQPVFTSTARDFIERAIREDREFLRSFDPGRDLASFEAAWQRRAAAGNADVVRFEPNYEGSPIVFGPPGGMCSAVGSHALEARAGHHLAPCTLSDGRAVYDCLGSGFSLLAFDTEPASLLAIRDAATAKGIPLTVIADAARGGGADYGSRLVLVRPDRFVAWAGEVLPENGGAVLLRAAGWM
jgi:2-polyprenyl-6-methoxyphenol hydroxylase-like FAD-dependent oxidoreductase